MIPSVPREAILTAMENFDADVRATGGWSHWQRNAAHKHALRHADVLYPPKKIVSLATGVPVSSFSGGPGTNDYLRALGFEVIPLTTHADPSSSPTDLQNAFKQVLSTYLQSRQSEGRCGRGAWVARAGFKSSDWQGGTGQGDEASCRAGMA